MSFKQKHTEKWKKWLGKRNIELGIRPPDRTGIKHTKKTRKLMSEKAKGKGNSQYGKKQSLESNLKRSKTLQGKNKGEKNGNWKGGIANNPYPEEWNYVLRWLIRQRDDFTCQECGKNQYETEKIFAVHHIDYNKNNNDFNNLITLCNSCHGKTTKTNKEEYYIKRYKRKVQRL